MSHGAGAAGFPSRNRAALALILFMHMAALLAWMQQRRALPRLPETSHVVSILLQPRTVRPRRPAVPPPSPSLPPSLPRSLPSRAAAPLTAPFPPPAPPDGKPAPSDDKPAPPPQPAAPGLDNAGAPVDVQQAIRAQKEAGGGFSLGLSKRQAGRIDRELRKGKSGIPDEPDTPMGRFRRGLEAAHIDRSMSVREDSYTAPDGVVIYRKRIGNATICRRSGSVNPLGMRGMLLSGDAGDVPCPRGVQWKED